MLSPFLGRSLMTILCTADTRQIQNLLATDIFIHIYLFLGFVSHSSLQESSGQVITKLIYIMIVKTIIKINYE